MEFHADEPAAPGGDLIAPCEMNCGLCVSYLGGKNDINRQRFHRKYCEGCLPRGKGCLYMAGSCALVGTGAVRFCFECPDFPCRRLKDLDRRYRARYRMSMIENLREIQENGMDAFLRKEAERWSCPSCGEMICCHKGLCLRCNLDVLKKNKKYCWGNR